MWSELGARCSAMIKRWMEMTMAICKPFGHSFFGFFCRRVVVGKCAVNGRTVDGVNHLPPRAIVPVLPAGRNPHRFVCAMRCHLLRRRIFRRWQSTFDDKCGSMWFVCLRFCNLSFRCRCPIQFPHGIFSFSFLFLSFRSSSTMHLLCVSTRQRRRTNANAIVPFLGLIFFCCCCRSLRVCRSFFHRSLLFFYLPSDYL